MLKSGRERDTARKNWRDMKRDGQKTKDRNSKRTRGITERNNETDRQTEQRKKERERGNRWRKEAKGKRKKG